MVECRTWTAEVLGSSPNTLTNLKALIAQLDRAIAYEAIG